MGPIPGETVDAISAYDKYIRFLIVKTSYLQNFNVQICCGEFICFRWDSNSGFSWSQIDNITTCRYCMTQFLFGENMTLGELNQSCIIEQNDSFRYFRLLMSTCSNSICENTFETSHVRFIHENFSVLITTPLDHIQQNLLRKETWQNTAKPADIVLQTWFEEYQTPP